jgi:hypothetical protein
LMPERKGGEREMNLAITGDMVVHVD